MKNKSARILFIEGELQTLKQQDHHTFEEVMRYDKLEVQLNRERVKLGYKLQLKGTDGKYKKFRTLNR